MGKKSYEDLNYWQKRDFVNDLGKQVGLDHRNYSDNEGESARNYTGKGSREDFEKEVLSRYQNNFDARMSNMLGSASDHKRFEDMPVAVSNLGEAYDLHKAMKKTAKKDLGITNYNSENDRAQVTNFLQQYKDDKFKKDILDSMPEQEQEQPSEQTPGALKPDPVLSERMQNSQNFLNQYALKVKNGDITEMITGNAPSDAIFDTRSQELGAEMSDVPGGSGAEDIKQDAPLDNTAQGFADKYTLRLKNTMKQNNMPTRGPGLIATMQLPYM